MPERLILDTTIIVRALVSDHPRHTDIARRLLEASDRGKVILVVLPVVLAECVFVLQSFYDQPRAQISTTLYTLLTSSGIEIEESPIYLDALLRYKKSKFHFTDCVLAAHAAARDLPIASFDADFKRFSDVKLADLEIFRPN